MTKRTPSKLVEAAKNETTEVAVAKSKSDTAKWRAKYNDAVKHAVNVEGRLDFLLSIGGKPKKKQIKAKRAKPGKGVAVIVPATDWHVEETVFAARTNGKNEFNIPEAERRIKRYYLKVLELIGVQNHLAPVVELWHPLLGDLLSGYIHEVLIETNGLSPTEACYFLKQMITA